MPPKTSSPVQMFNTLSLCFSAQHLKSTLLTLTLLSSRVKQRTAQQATVMRIKHIWVICLQFNQKLQICEVCILHTDIGPNFSSDSQIGFVSSRDLILSLDQRLFIPGLQGKPDRSKVWLQFRWCSTSGVSGSEFYLAGNIKWENWWLCSLGCFLYLLMSSNFLDVWTCCPPLRRSVQQLHSDWAATLIRLVSMLKWVGAPVWLCIHLQIGPVVLFARKMRRHRTTWLHDLELSSIGELLLVRLSPELSPVWHEPEVADAGG